MLYNVMVHRIRATYGDNYERLQEIKAEYDPENVFHVNQNIEPARRQTDHDDDTIDEPTHTPLEALCSMIPRVV